MATRPIRRDPINGTTNSGGSLHGNSGGGGGNSGGGGGKPRKKDKTPTQLDWMDPDYGYEQTKGAVDPITGLPKKGKKVYKNPAGLGEKLGRTPIYGVNEALFGGKSPVGGLALSNKPMTADQAMYLFEHLAESDQGKATLTALKQKLYLANLYPDKTYVPRPGIYTKEDKAAFKNMLIGLASSPGQAPLNTYLDEAAALGELYGGSGHERKPFQAVVSDPVSLKGTFQGVANQIYGGDLPDEEVAAMVDAFRMTQVQKQRALYDAGATDSEYMTEAPTGGVFDSPDMSAQAYASEEIKKKHPQQMDRIKFQSTMDSIMGALKGPLAGGTGGGR